MKAFIRLATAPLLVSGGLVALVWACSQNGPNPQLEGMKQFEQITAQTKNAKMAGIKVPDGTSVYRVSTSEIRFQFPTGMHLVTRGKDGLLLVDPGSGYKCKCSKDKEGCNVVEISGNYGCAEGTCTGTCTGSHTRLSGETINPDGGGFVDMNRGVKILSGESDLTQQFDTPDAELLMALPEVKSALEKFFATAYKDVEKAELEQLRKGEMPKGFIEWPVNIFGKNVTVSLPITHLRNLRVNLVDPGEGGGGGYTCKCNQGTGCTKKSVFLPPYGTVHSCEGGQCSDCEMKSN